MTFLPFFYHSYTCSVISALSLSFLPFLCHSCEGRNPSTQSKSREDILLVDSHFWLLPTSAYELRPKISVRQYTKNHTTLGVIEANF